MITINIDEKLAYTLSVVSERDAVTPELWIERKINAILNQHKVEEIVNTVKADIDSYAPVIIAKKEEIIEVKRVEAEAIAVAVAEAKALEDAKIIDIIPEEETATSTPEII